MAPSHEGAILIENLKLKVENQIAINRNFWFVLVGHDLRVVPKNHKKRNDT